MSASRRHSSAEENILARLERDGKRGSAVRSWKNLNMTMAWCGLASLAVIGLIAVLASLAKENMTAHRQPLAPEAKAPVDRYADADGRSGFALPAIGSPPRRHGTAVVDLPALTRERSAEPPPMVMLKPATPAKPAPPPAARGAAPKAAPKSARPAPVKLAAAPSSPRVDATLSRPKKLLPPPIATVARPKKIAPAPAVAKLEPAPVDSDVALLSAIIMHASRHAGERAQIEAQACPAGKKCASAKTTD